MRILKSLKIKITIKSLDTEYVDSSVEPSDTEYYRTYPTGIFPHHPHPLYHMPQARAGLGWTHCGFCVLPTGPGCVPLGVWGKGSGERPWSAENGHQARQLSHSQVFMVSGISLEGRSVGRSPRGDRCEDTQCGATCYHTLNFNNIHWILCMCQALG